MTNGMLGVPLSASVGSTSAGAAPGSAQAATSAQRSGVIRERSEEIPPRAVIEYVVGVFLRGLVFASARPFTPIVRFRHPTPEDPADYRRILGDGVEFGAALVRLSSDAKRT